MSEAKFTPAPAMPKIPTIADCTFHYMAVGFIGCKFGAVSGAGANRPEAYRNFLDNLHDACCESLDRAEQNSLYSRLQDARNGAW